MSQVDIAVGIGGTVMQDILLPPCPVLPDARINVLLLPALQHVGFAPGQVPLHREIRFWQ